MAMRVDPGELNERIEIRRQYQCMRNGFPVLVDETVFTVWAKVSRETGTEYVKHDTEERQERIRVLVRSSAVNGISEDMQIVTAGNKAYDIDYIHEYYRSGYLEIIAYWRG